MLAKIVTLNSKFKKISPFSAKNGKNHFFKQEI